MKFVDEALRMLDDVQDPEVRGPLERAIREAEELEESAPSTICILEDMPDVVRALMHALKDLKQSGWRIVVCRSQFSARRHKAVLRKATLILVDRDCPYSSDSRFDDGSFHREIPADCWTKCISISVVSRWNTEALENGAMVAHKKDFADLTGWAKKVAATVNAYVR